MARFDMNYYDLDKRKEKNSAIREYIEWTETVLISFFIVILIFTFAFRNSVVNGESMMPTLKNNDRVIATHIMYTPENGDIVVVDNNDPSLDKMIVKRIIATAGQTVDIDFMTGQVSVDGTVLEEDYINELTMLDEGGHNYPVTVPKDCVFVMGDNRNNSTDSRSDLVSFVNEEDILGKVIFRYFPFNAIGSPE